MAPVFLRDSITYGVSMPVKTIQELFKPAFGVQRQATQNWKTQSNLRIGEDNLRQLNFDAFGIDQHGNNSWRWLRLLDTLRRERQDKNQILRSL